MYWFSVWGTGPVRGLAHDPNDNTINTITAVNLNPWLQTFSSVGFSLSHELARDRNLWSHV